MCSLAGVNTHYQTNCVFLYPCFFNVYYTFCIISYQILKPLLPPLNKKTHSFHYFYSSSFFLHLSRPSKQYHKSKSTSKKKKSWSSFGQQLLARFYLHFIFLLENILSIYFGIHAGSIYKEIFIDAQIQFKRQFVKKWKYGGNRKLENYLWSTITYPVSRK